MDELPTINPGQLHGFDLNDLYDNGIQINIPHLPNLPITSWDFEFLGLNGWTKTGTAFDHQPTYGHNVFMLRGNIPVTMPLKGTYWHKAPYPIGNKNKFWIGTFDNRPSSSESIPLGQVQGDGPRGTLTSDAFTIRSNFITFLIGGGRDEAHLRVELLVEQSSGSFLPDTHFKATGVNSELLARKWWDVRSLIGRKAKIQIVDDSSGGWGHINVDDIRFQDRDPLLTPVYIGARKVASANIGVLVPGDVLSLTHVDYDAPVWGVADMHAHPASHLGFGANLDQNGNLVTPGIFWGKPGMDFNQAEQTIAQDLASCDGSTHGRADVDAYNPEQRIRLMDGINGQTGYVHHSGGYPLFDNWPRPYSSQHQQMHVSWLFRAWQGGLRLLIASVMDVQTFAAIFHRGFDLGAGPFQPDTQFDMKSARVMIKFIKEFAQANSGWMRIVYTPEEARETIRSGQLAVILSAEMDKLSTEQILELQREDGLRHVTPIHFVDNVFGGPAAYGDLFNANNYTLNGWWYAVKGDPHLKFRLGRPHFLQVMPFGLLGVGEINDDDYWSLGYECHPDPARRVPNCVEKELGHRNARPARGQEILRLMTAGLMIDTAHMSEDTMETALQLSERFHYPLNNSHTGLRPDELGYDERAMKVSHVKRMAAQGGVLGLGTGPIVKTEKLIYIKPQPGVRAHRMMGEMPSWTISVRQPLNPDQRVNQIALTLTKRPHIAELGYLNAGLRVSYHSGEVEEYPINPAGIHPLGGGAEVNVVKLNREVNLADIKMLTLRAGPTTQYWSIFDLEAEPSLSDDLLVRPVGPAGLVQRFTGDRKTFSSVPDDPTIPGDPSIENLYITIGTGANDDLKDGRGVRLKVEVLSETAPRIYDLTRPGGFPGGSNFSWKFAFDPPVRRSQIMRLTIEADTGGGWTDSDNWDMNELKIRGASAVRDRIELHSRPGEPLIRLHPIAPERVFYVNDKIDRNQMITRLAFGFAIADDVRGNTHVHAAVRFNDGSPEISEDLNGGAGWGGDSSYRPIMNLPRGTRRGAIDQIVMFYHSGQAEASDTTDNWDIMVLQIDAYFEEEDPVRNWVNVYREALEVLDYQSIALGTDMNGMAPTVPFARQQVQYFAPGSPGSENGLVPCVTGQKTWDFTKDGLAHYGMLPDFFQAISQDETMTPEMIAPLFLSAEAVIRMWERVERASFVINALIHTPPNGLPVKLRAYNGQFVYAANGGSLLASASPDPSFEKFTLRKIANRYEFEAAQGGFISVVSGQENVQIQAQSQNSLHLLAVMPVGENRVALRAPNDKFLDASASTGIKADAETISPTAIFELVPAI